MKLRTSKTPALERAKGVPFSPDIELLGTEALSEFPEFKLSISNGDISSTKNSFLSVYGTDCKFFYSVEIKSDSIGFIERGLGYVEQHDGKFFLKRNRPFYYIENGNAISLTKPRPIAADDSLQVIAASYAPTTYIELLTDANALITSTSPHLPTSVVVDNHSLLGRLDGEIESLKISDIVNEGRISEIALNAIKQHTKNLILKSSKVDVKRLTTNDLQLHPQKSAPERKGVLYYDESENCLKYYDGEKWRTLTWTEDK
jgi:hypothetical protein